MDSILIILKKKWPKGFICPYTGTIFYNIRIYSRSQVSVYRTIGPLVSDPNTKKFMASTLDKVFGFPQFVRISWSTASNIIDKNGVLFRWSVLQLYIDIMINSKRTSYSSKVV